MSDIKLDLTSVIDWIGRLRFVIWMILFLSVIIIVYFEIDSRFQLSQLKDAQRRIGTLEQQCGKP